MEEFIEMLKGEIPKLTINRYLKELKEEKKIIFHGNPQITKGENRGYWGLTS